MADNVLKNAFGLAGAEQDVLADVGYVARDAPLYRTFTVRDTIEFARATNLQNATRVFQAGERHYDIGNDFYKLWLDQQLLYTCAYFPHPDATLEEAQIAKMDHVCRKLQLKAGESVVEAGGGWGGFALFMAKNYGVRAVGIDINPVRIAEANAEAERLRLRVAELEAQLARGGEGKAK